MTTWTVGQLVTAALMNSNIQALGGFVLAPPLAQILQTLAQSIPTGNTWTALNFDTNVLDSDSGHSTVTNTSRYVIQVPGTYLTIGCYVLTNPNSTAGRAARIAKNGSPVQGSAAAAPPVSGLVTTVATTPVLVPCVGGDYLEVHAQQGSGAAVNTYSDTSFTSSLLVLRVSN